LTRYEIGAGTGAITEALVQKNPNARLILFELDEDLAAKLKKRYPQADVLAGQPSEHRHLNATVSLTRGRAP
jgi:phosphatidylethanolamine/phosphatidyl-N-methylethanolamine N-methyltransferase